MSVCTGMCSGCFGDFFVWLCRFWGLATAVGVWGIGVETTFYGHYLGYYLLAVALLVTFLEVMFAADFCVTLCISEGSCFRTVWGRILCLDDWKKGVFYILLSIACFVQPVDAWLAVIGGVMLIFSGIFYILKTFKSRVEKERIKLPQQPSYDKFDELEDDVEDDDDNVIRRDGTITILIEESVGKQVEILEV